MQLNVIWIKTPLQSVEKWRAYLILHVHLATQKNRANFGSDVQFQLPSSPEDAPPCGHHGHSKVQIWPRGFSPPILPGTALTNSAAPAKGLGLTLWPHGAQSVVCALMGLPGPFKGSTRSELFYNTKTSLASFTRLTFALMVQRQCARELVKQLAIGTDQGKDTKLYWWSLSSSPPSTWRKMSASFTQA